MLYDAMSMAQLAKVLSLCSQDHGFKSRHCVTFKEFIGLRQSSEKQPIIYAAVYPAVMGS